ncbi:MAG: tetratricopeptide repeat protein [Candidatus Eiseniibacteriota bacterium]
MRISPRGASLAIVFTAFALTARPAAAKEYSYEANPVRLGTSALKEGKLAEAKAHFEEAIANDHELPRARHGLAEVLSRQGNLSTAEPLYRQALDGGGTFPEAHAGLGLLLLRAGRIEEARAEIAQALREKDDLWDAHYAKALLLIRDTRLEEAKQVLSKGAKKKGLKDGEDRFHHGMAHWYLVQGNLENAEKEALLATTLNPSEVDYVELLADIYARRGQPGLAIQSYEKVLDTPGAEPSAPFYHQLGKLFEEIREPNEALRRYQEAVKIDSTFAPALRDMGRLYSLGKVHDKAFLAYKRTVQLAPDDLESLVQLVRSALEVRQVADAHDAGKRAFAIDSSRVDIRLLYARAASQNKDAPRAAELYATVPDSLLEAVDHVRLGQIAFEAKNWEGALTHLRLGTAEDSTSAEGFYILGLAEMNSKNPEAAAAALERATVLAPSFTPALLNLGVAQLQAGRNLEGVATLRKAQVLAPENVNVLLSLGQALAGSDSTDAAIATYREIIDRDPENARAYRGLGTCQMQKKSYGEARTALMRATALDGGNADAWALLGQAYLGLNDVLRAQQAAQKCLAIDPGHARGRSVLDTSKQAQASRGTP